MLAVINTLASLLTATALLLHAVLGCCVHHHHGHPPLTNSIPGAVSDVATHSLVAAGSHHGHVHHAAGCGHDHRTTAREVAEPAGGHESSGDNRHDHHAPCEEGSCQWVGTEAPVKLVPGAGSLTDFPAPAPTVLTASLLLALQPGHPGGAAGEAPAPDAPRSGLALRQVWRL